MHFSIQIQILAPKHPHHTNKPKHAQIQNFEFPLCPLCPLSTHASTSGKVLNKHTECLLSTRACTSGKVFNKHTNRDNSGNNIGRQVQFTSEVTPIGPILCLNYSPIQLLLTKLSTILLPTKPSHGFESKFDPPFGPIVSYSTFESIQIEPLN